MPNSTAGDTFRNVTPHMLAVTMLGQVMKETNQWRFVEAAVTSECDRKCPMVCEVYQLRFFLDLVKQRFGNGISSLIESSLTIVTDEGGTNSDTNLFSKLMEAISLARELGPATDGPDGSGIGMDFQVADQTLRLISESHTEKQAFRLVLAESLTYARLWAENIFPQVVAKIKFDPLSIAFVKVETAYKGMTNRWRENPGCFERHLQRMEGNPLFPESCRNPTDDDILLAQTKDDSESEKLVQDVRVFLSTFNDLLDQGPMLQRTILDLVHNNIEPLMVRAAEIGLLPTAQLQLQTLRSFRQSLLKNLTLTSHQIEGINRTLRPLVNTFIAQEWRSDTPSRIPGSLDFLLCESIEDIKVFLNIYQEMDPALASSRMKMALLGLDTLEAEGFNLPGADQKRALFADDGDRIANPIKPDRRSRWRFWRSDGKDS